MKKMNITSAQYIEVDGNKCTIVATIDNNRLWVPIDPDNRHYAALLDWEEEAGNEIQAAE